MSAITFTMGSGGVPAGHYNVEFLGCEPFESGNQEYGPGFLFKFKVLGGTHDGEETSRITGAKCSPKSALGKLLSAMSGGKLATGAVVNPSDYIGKRFMAIVEETDSGSTRVGSVIPVA